jgi:hypothetical protein
VAILVAVAALALARESGGDGRPSDDAARVRQVVDTIRIAIQADDWKTVYQSFADDYRAQCAEDDFVAGAIEQGPAFKAVKLEVDEVVVEGDTATASMTFSNDEQGEWPFVREDGEWHLLSAVGIEGCGFATPTPTPTATP